MADTGPLPEVRLAEAVPVRDRLAIYRDAVCRSLVSLSVDIPDGDGFTAYVRARPLGVLRVTEVQSQPQIVHRTPRLINTDDERYLKVGMLLTGRCVVTQREREAVLGPGDLVCYDTAVPYGFRMQSPFALAVFMLPATHVEHRLRGFDQVTATAFSGREGLGAVVAEMLRALHAGSESITGEAAVHVGDAAVDLVAGLVAERSGRPLDEKAGAAALRARARRYIEEHLVDPDLAAADIAAACGISVRYLYKLFELEETAVSTWIRNRRLDRVERDLADPRLAHRSIAHIGARWGFTDAPAFSRTFRARRGITAREFRALALRPPDPG